MSAASEEGPGRPRERVLPIEPRGLPRVGRKKIHRRAAEHAENRNMFSAGSPSRADQASANANACFNRLRYMNNRTMPQMPKTSTGTADTTWPTISAISNLPNDVLVL